MFKRENVAIVVMSMVLIGVVVGFIGHQLSLAKSSAWRLGCLDSGKLTVEQCRTAERIYNR